MLPNFKDAFKEIWRCTIFCQATTKILCSSMTILPQVILFHKHDQDSSFIDFFGYSETFACLRCKHGNKSEKLVTIRFLHFLQTPNFIFCCSVFRAITNVLGKYFYFTRNPLLSPPSQGICTGKFSTFYFALKIFLR